MCLHWYLLCAPALVLALWGWVGIVLALQLRTLLTDTHATRTSAWCRHPLCCQGLRRMQPADACCCCCGTTCAWRLGQAWSKQHVHSSRALWHASSTCCGAVGWGYGAGMRCYTLMLLCSCIWSLHARHVCGGAVPINRAAGAHRPLHRHRHPMCVSVCVTAVRRESVPPRSQTPTAIPSWAVLQAGAGSPSASCVRDYVLRLLVGPAISTAVKHEQPAPALLHLVLDCLQQRLVAPLVPEPRSAAGESSHVSGELPDTAEGGADKIKLHCWQLMHAALALEQQQARHLFQAVLPQHTKMQSSAGVERAQLHKWHACIAM